MLYPYHLKQYTSQSFIPAIYRFFIPLCAIVLLTILNAHAAFAHTRAEIGPYVVIVGWLEEPPIVGERNAIIVDILQDDEAVEGAESGLDAEIQYAGRTFRANLNPTETPGFYTITVYPTVRGQYDLRLFGTLGDETVDEIIPPEEIQSAARLQFPEAQPDPIDLQKKIDALEGQLQSTLTFAYGGIGLGALGIILALAAFLRRR